jgi:hypothetical protein
VNDDAPIRVTVVDQNAPAQLKFDIACADRTAHVGATICWLCGWNRTNGALPWEADE